MTFIDLLSIVAQKRFCIPHTGAVSESGIAQRMQSEWPWTASDKIDVREHLVLPAIQRDFVWPEDKVLRLLDSIMRGYYVHKSFVR